MRTRKHYFPIALVAVVVGTLLLLSSPPKWFAKPHAFVAAGQEPSSGPKSDVGETVLVPKKTEPAPVQPEKKPEKINPNNVYTLSTTTSLVNVDVMVVDASGNPIHNLEKKNFQLYDDGVPQAITNFGTGEAPVTVCMMVEFSDTWWGYGLYLAVRYGYDFLDSIHPKDWVGLVAFDMKPQIITDFTQDRSEIREGLGTLRVPGFNESCLYDSIAFVLDRMKEVHGRKAILIVATGNDTFSKLTYDQFLKIVRASDTPIYPISIVEFIRMRYPGSGSIPTGLGRYLDPFMCENTLRTIANYSGGQAYFPRFEQELPADYQQIAEQLRLQYSLGFVPTNATKDGQFHKLKVAVVDDQGNPLTIFNQKGKKIKYHIVARDGYYSPKT